VRLERSQGLGRFAFQAGSKVAFIGSKRAKI